MDSKDDPTCRGGALPVVQKYPAESRGISSSESLLRTAIRSPRAKDAVLNAPASTWDRLAAIRDEEGGRPVGEGVGMRRPRRSLPPFERCAGFSREPEDHLPLGRVYPNSSLLSRRRDGRPAIAGDPVSVWPRVMPPELKF